jgi:hypothetical protein
VTPAGVIVHAEGSEYIVGACQAPLEGNDLADGVRTSDGGKTMSDIDAELGPVDYVVVAFPTARRFLQ